MLRPSKSHETPQRTSYDPKKHDDSPKTTSSVHNYVLYAIIVLLGLYIIHLRSIHVPPSILSTTSTSIPDDSSIFSLSDDAHPHFWGNRQFDADSFIDQLSTSVDADTLKTCKSMMTPDDLSKRDIWSQAYQEWYLYHNFFYGKTNGIYLDIGAHKPLHLSNSAFFDVCLGWKGIWYVQHCLVRRITTDF